MAKQLRDEASGNELLLRAAAGGSLATARHALELGANLETRGDIGRTALIAAVVEGHEEMVDMLLGFGARVDPTDIYGATALICSALSNNSACMGLLLAAGAKSTMNALDHDGFSAAKHSLRCDFVETFALLLDAGADVDSMRPNGSALHHAAFYGSLECLRLLVKLGAPLAKRDSDSKTPAMWAARRGEKGAAMALMAAGADMMAVDEHGISAVDWARASYHEELADELSKAIALAEAKGLGDVVAKVAQGSGTRKRACRGRSRRF